MHTRPQLSADPVTQASPPVRDQRLRRRAGGTPALPGVAALLFVLLLPSIQLRAADDSRPELGSQGSGVVDENGQKVGDGPDLHLVGPAPPEPEDDARAPWIQSMEWLRTFLDGLGRTEKDLVYLKASLWAGQIRLRELRDELADYTKTRDKALTDGLKMYLNERIFQASTEVAELEAEQRKLMVNAMGRWQETLGNLDAKIAESEDFPAFQSALRNLRESVVQKQSLSELEVLLSGGLSQEFRAKANQAVAAHPALESPVLMLKVADLVERGQGREALYAARLGQERFPDNPAFNLCAEEMETSYLRMISAKAAGDGAEIHRAWNGYAGTVTDSYVREFFFGGLTKPLQYFTGQADALETLHGNATDRAVMEHNGIEVILRLRAKGLSFDEIRGLSSEQLRQRAGELFGDQVDLSAESARGLSLALRAAFRNDDVQRVLTQNKQQFDVDLGRSYYGAEEYDSGILEYAVDAVNVKNVILFFGPSAVVSYGARQPGMMAQLAQRMGAPEKLAQAFSPGTGAVTVREWIGARPTMQAMAAALGRTRGGKAALQGLETLRYMRYDAPGAVQFGTGLTEAAAQMVMFEAGGKVGHALSGEFGEFIGQALVMLAGNPIADVQAASEKELLATAEQMQRTRAAWERQNQVLKKLRAPIHQSVEAAAAGDTLVLAERQALQAAVNEADTLALKVGESALEQATADEASALASAGRHVLQGEEDLAKLADDLAEGIERNADEAAESLVAGERATRRLAANAPPEPPGPPPRARTGQVALENESWPTKGSQTRRLDRSQRPVTETPGPEPPPLPEPVEAPLKLGDAAMTEERFGDAVAHYRTAFREAETNAARAEAYTKMRDARGAAQYTQVMESRARRMNMQEVARKADQAMEPFGPVERRALQDIQYEDTIPMKGSAGGPRKVVDKGGRALGVWKPKGVADGRSFGQMNEDGQLIAELLFSRIARRLGLRVPHAEPYTLTQVVNGQVVRHEGVLSRWIPQPRQLSQLTQAARMTLTSKMAKIRALNIYLGNYDVHMGNYIVDRAGNVWGIDAGMAVLATPTDAISSWSRLVPGLDTTGTDALVYSRLLRDWYPATRPQIRQLDELMRFEDMVGVADDLKALDSTALGAEIEAVMGAHHPMFGEVNHTLDTRRLLIRRLLVEGFDTAPPPRPTRGALLLFPQPWPVALRPAA